MVGLMRSRVGRTAVSRSWSVSRQRREASCRRRGDPRETHRRRPASGRGAVLVGERARAGADAPGCATTADADPARDGPCDGSRRRRPTSRAGSRRRTVTLSGPLRTRRPRRRTAAWDDRPLEPAQADRRSRPLRRRAAKHRSSRPRRHAMAEAVPLGPLPVVRLVGALHSLPPRPETTESCWRLTCSIDVPRSA